MTLWRISNHADLGGWGGLKFASRWSSLGRRIVYLADSPASALLEILVHLPFEDDQLPDNYQLLEIDAPDDLEPMVLTPPHRIKWRENVNVTRRLGDAWLDGLKTPLARVPSAVVPRTFNYLLNPRHPEADRIKIVSVARERFDLRLLRARTL